MSAPVLPRAGIGEKQGRDERPGRPVVLFVRLDSEDVGASCYRIGPPRAWAVFSPPRGLAEAVACLQRLAGNRGRWLDVTDLWDGRETGNRRKSVRESLGRAARAIGQTSFELGTVLAWLQTRVMQDGVQACIADKTNGYAVVTDDGPAPR